MSYAYISYYTAYFKHYYTIEFFTALMTIFGDDKDKLLEYIKDAQDFNIEVTTPSINSSEDNFSIKDDSTITYGFGSIKGLPENAIEVILEKRPFTNIEDIIARTRKKDVNKRAVDSLVWSGALDELHGPDRLNTLKMFYTARGDANRIDELPKESDLRQMLDEEKDLLGIYLSQHPLDIYSEHVDWEKVKKTNERINTFGLITGYRVIQTKHGDDMAFVDLEFKGEYVNGVMFPNVFSKEVKHRAGSKIVPLGRYIQEDIIVKVSAYFSEDHRGGLSFVIADMAVPVKPNESKEKLLLEIEEQYGYDEVIEPEMDRPAPKTL